MGSIDSRLRRLEERRGGGICSECGYPPNYPEGRAIAVINEKYPEKSFDGDPDERCAHCGQPLYIVIRVVYGERKATGGGE